MSISRLLALGAVTCALIACGAKDTPSTDEAATSAPAAEEKVATPPAPATQPTALTPVAPEPIPPEAAIPEDTIATVLGKGDLERADGKLAKFKYDVFYRSGGVVNGTAEYTTFLDEGKVDLTVELDCGVFDVETKRAWFGGKISDNRSNHSEYKDGRYAKGGQAWFRFEESMTHPEPPAQVADIRFAGDDGFETAAEFCKAKPWSNDGLADLSDQGAVIIFALPDQG
jgi:hypothetical protein